MSHAPNGLRYHCKVKTGNLTDGFIPDHMAFAANSGIALVVTIGRSVTRDGRAWLQADQVSIPSA